MHAAIIEFNTLADAVWPATQNDDFLPRCRAAFADWNAKTAFIGRIHIGRFRSEFGSASINALIGGRDTKLGAQSRHIGFAASGEVREALIGKAHGLNAAQRRGVTRQAIGVDIRLRAYQLFNFPQEPGIEFAGFVNRFNAHARTHGLRGDQDAIGLRGGECGMEGLRAAITWHLHLIKARKAYFQTA